jgi:hypothetical protein
MKKRKKLLENLPDSNVGKVTFVEEYDEFDWFQLIFLDQSEPIFEDQKENMRVE